MLTEYQVHRLEKDDRIDISLADLRDACEQENGTLFYGGIIDQPHDLDNDYILSDNTSKTITTAKSAKTYLAATVISANCDGIMIQFDLTKRSVMLSYLEAMACVSLY